MASTRQRLLMVPRIAGALSGLGVLLPAFPTARAADPPAAACTDTGIFGEYDTRPELQALCPAQPSNPTAVDTDGDGIEDVLDVARGARKAALNNAEYKSLYVVLSYPGGDIPRTIGVCTDVIVRAMRNAGLDLQKLVHDDIVSMPSRYSWVQRSDTSIDHRRVRNLIPTFESHFEERAATVHETDPAATRYRDWRPGDIVFLDTFPDRFGVEHVGVVSERATDGRPMIVNNWTDGYRTSDMDLLSFVKVVRRFRPLPRSARP